MVANPGKFQIIFLGPSINNNIIFIVENKHIKSNNEAKILRITIYHKLLFTKHINTLCNTASKTFENFDKNKEIFISRADKTSSWSLYNVDFQTLSSNMGVFGKTENKFINKIQNRTLQLIYDTEDGTFGDLLRRGKSRTIQEDTSHKSLVEIYKWIN